MDAGTLLLLGVGCRPEPPPEPPAEPTEPAPCEDAQCDDGLDCSVDACDASGRCVYTPVDDAACDWPTALPPDDDIVALAGLDDGFRISLSGATWNPVTRSLWVVRGDGAVAWRLVEDAAAPTGWAIDHASSLGAVDAESVVIPDPEGLPNQLYVMIELREQITRFDASGAVARTIRTWDTSPYLPAVGTSGSEGLAFVPDDALTAWGFVDPDGNPRVSTLGLGGLFFVGHQNGGAIYVFDLPDGDEPIAFVGAYDTARTETSGLEFDPGTGRLYVWHGSDLTDLEVVRLSSTDVGGENRKLDTEYVFDYPGDPNIEGIALLGVDDCVDGVRPLILTIDDGLDRALDVYTQWPLCPSRTP